MKKRIMELDMAKGLAILIIFFRHTLEYTAIATYNPALYKIVGTFSEALMIMFLLFSGYTFKSKKSLKEDLSNKFKTLLLPFIIATSIITIIYFFIFVVPGNMSFNTFILNTISNFLSSNQTNLFNASDLTNYISYAVVPLWYIAELIIPFILVIFLSRYVIKDNLIKKIIFAIICLGLGITFNILDLQGTVANSFSIPYSFFIVLPNIFGFTAILLLGNIFKDLKLFDLDHLNKYLKYILFGLSLIIYILLFIDYDNSFAFQCGKWGQYGWYSFIISTVCGISLSYLLVFIFYYLKRIKFINNIFSYLGKNSLYILLSHCMIVEIISRIFNYWHTPYLETFPIEEYSLVISLIIVFISLIIVILTSLLKNLIKEKISNKRALA